jgi:hypothetical protein
VLDRIHAEAIDVRQRDPELKCFAEVQERGGRPVVVDRSRPLVNVLQALEIPLSELGLVIPVANPALAGERRRLLQLGGPERSVGKFVCCNLSERERRIAGRVAESGDAIHGPVRLPAGFLPNDVPVVVAYIAPELLRPVREDISSMIEDHVEDDADAVMVGGSHQRHQVISRAEMRVDVQEVLAWRECRSPSPTRRDVART